MVEDTIKFGESLPCVMSGGGHHKDRKIKEHSSLKNNLVITGFDINIGCWLFRENSGK